MNSFFGMCSKILTEECSKKVLRKTSLDWDHIKRCVDSSFHGINKTSYLNDNEILADEKEKFKKLGTASFPNVFINNALYKVKIKREAWHILTFCCQFVRPCTMKQKSAETWISTQMTKFPFIT